MSHRLPPKPIHYDTAPKGTCRFCGQGIFDKTGKPKTRSHWHPACVVEYKLLYWVAATRRAVWNRDRGKCAHCGTMCSRKGPQGWDMDHINPLINNTTNDLSFWRLPNLQTLCKKCHRVKTSAEATQRAADRALKKKLDPPQ